MSVVDSTIKYVSEKKFISFILALFALTISVWHGKIDDSVYQALVTILIPSYLASDIADVYFTKKE